MQDRSFGEESGNREKRRKNVKYRNSRRFCAVYAALLIAFTAYALLDTFVIPRSYAAAADNMSAQTAAGSDAEKTAGVSEQTDAGAQTDESTAPAAVQSEIAAQNRNGDEDVTAAVDAAATDTDTAEADIPTETAAADDGGTEIGSYSDDEISIVLKQYREYDTDIYVADVVLSSADSLKTALAENTYGRNIKEKTSAIASEAGAILAINGDFYGSQNRGYVIRNGVLYRDSSDGNEDLAIMSDGSFEIVEEYDTDAQSLLDSGAQQVLTFGPALLIDGSVNVTENQEVGKARESNPRTAIAQVGELHYLFVVADGRTDQSAGLSLYELAQFLQDRGAQTAYNLDGGGSSTMVFQGTVINQPTSDGREIRERSVSDIVYIG